MEKEMKKGVLHSDTTRVSTSHIYEIIELG